MEADKRGLLAPFYLELNHGTAAGRAAGPFSWTDLDVENRTISIKAGTRTKGRGTGGDEAQDPQFHPRPCRGLTA